MQLCGAVQRLKHNIKLLLLSNVSSYECTTANARANNRGFNCNSHVFHTNSWYLAPFVHSRAGYAVVLARTW
jgi:hypothetical protein